jgi:lipopolysaccharide/colanic/teichoic acid biosynthesis glycosyltransferase
LRAHALAEPVPYPLLKSAIDKVVSAVLLVLVSPLGLAALAAMAVDMLLVPQDRGPFLYREARISLGCEFALLKLRTLRVDVLAAGAAGHVRLFEADTANLTRAGRLLKRWYLDELPQLVNILRGDISLVGPRPWPPPMVAEQVAVGFDYRNRIKAGWTGPAQITKGSPDPVSYAELDLAYVEACQTLRPARLARYDLGILARTVLVILRGEGLRY